MKISRRIPLLLPAAALLLMASLTSPAAIECPLGDPVSASLGDGVVLHSCSWEKTPGVFVRSGPLELVRHGTLILKLQTDADGTLQGEYSAWDDAGVIIENGHYVDGLKHGEWLVSDSDGRSRILHFRAGVEVTP